MSATVVQRARECLQDLTPDAVVANPRPSCEYGSVDATFSALTQLLRDAVLRSESRQLGHLVELLRDAHDDYARRQAQAEHGEAAPLGVRQLEAKGRLLGLRGLCFDAAQRMWPDPEQAGVADGVGEPGGAASARG